MDIRFINREGNIVNVTNLSILREGMYLIGMNERGNKIVMEKYESEEEAKEKIRIIGNNIIIATQNGEETITIDGRRKESEW